MQEIRVTDKIEYVHTYRYVVVLSLLGMYVCICIHVHIYVCCIFINVMYVMAISYQIRT